MKKTFKILLVVVFATQILQAQRIEQIYIQMPEVLNPVISRQQRFELLEYYKANMGDSIQNRFGTQTRILKLDAENNHIIVQNTDISRFEIKLIPHRNDTIIGIIRTVCVPICQSSIEFFSMNWQRRTDITFVFPQAKEWINEEKVRKLSLHAQNVRNALSTSFVSLTFNSETSEIHATNHSIAFLDQAQQEELAPVMNDAAFIFRLKNNRKWTRIE